MFVARYRDGSLDPFAVDPFTLFAGNKLLAMMRASDKMR
jgi:hypothetical protein